MQRFGRLQLHGPAGRQPGAQCNDQSHKQQHPTKTDRKAPPSEREIILNMTTNTNGTTVVSNSHPSAVKNHPTRRRVLPSAIRRPVSQRRCSMRSQNVPVIPKSTLSRMKTDSRRLILIFRHSYCRRSLRCCFISSMPVI